MDKGGKGKKGVPWPHIGASFSHRVYVKRLMTFLMSISVHYIA